jgi:hypothetical protein
VDRPSLGHHPEAAAYAGNDPYDVAVVGRRADGAVLLDDECLDPIAVPAEVFAAARAAHRKSRHRMLVVDDGAAPVDLAAAARAAIAVTVHDLTEDVMAKNFAGNFGLRGLAKWAGAVADRRTRHGWTRLYAGSAAHAHAMQRIYDCLTTEYSSPGAMRPLYADFLDQVAPLLDDPVAAREAADRYAQAGALWSQIADTATSGALARYRELVERRLELLIDRGADAAEELASVAAETAAFTRDLQLSDDERATRLDAVAELAGRVLEVEREACAALAATVRS